jgi:hypothetical protein
VAKIRKERLSARETHRRVHDRLRDTAVAIAWLNASETKGS